MMDEVANTTAKAPRPVIHRFRSTTCSMTGFYIANLLPRVKVLARGEAHLRLERGKLLKAIDSGRDGDHGQSKTMTCIDVSGSVPHKADAGGCLFAVELRKGHTVAEDL